VHASNNISFVITMSQKISRSLYTDERRYLYVGHLSKYWRTLSEFENLVRLLKKILRAVTCVPYCLFLKLKNGTRVWTDSEKNE
jgi:hypothetical protein